MHDTQDLLIIYLLLCVVFVFRSKLETEECLKVFKNKTMS